MEEQIDLTDLHSQTEWMGKFLEGYDKNMEKNWDDYDDDTQSKMMHMQELIKTIISNLWELKKEKSGGSRPTIDMMAMLAAEKGGGSLVDVQIDYMQNAANGIKEKIGDIPNHLPMYRSWKHQIEMGESIIASLKELKQIKGWN